MKNKLNLSSCLTRSSSTPNRGRIKSKPVFKQKLFETEDCEIITLNDESNDCVLIEPSLNDIIYIDEEDGKHPVIKTPKRTEPFKLTDNIYIDNKANYMLKYNVSENHVNSTQYHKKLPKLNCVAECDSNKSETMLFTTNDKAKLDDSVIFVSETHPDDFIPLTDKTDKTKLKQSRKKLEKSTETPTKSSTLQLTNLALTASEKKEILKYNNNTYNPANGHPKQLSKKRMILIDGSNVAFGHGLSNDFSVKGIEISIKYFSEMGHNVKALVPQFRRNYKKSSDPGKLDALCREGKLIFTPCKVLSDKKVTCYDDRLILQLAVELDAAIVSNDNYLDLIHENAAFKKIVENRVINYMWCEDIFVLAKDPYGRWGPTLDMILNRE